MRTEDRDGWFDQSPLTRRQVVVGGMALAGAGLLAACGGKSSGTASAKKKRGGALKIAMISGGATETLDPYKSIFNSVDQARLENLYDNIVELGPGGKSNLGIVNEAEPSPDAKAWTLRIREGAEWHNGKPVTADDLIYTLKRATDPAASSATRWGPVDRNALKKRDGRTVEVTFKTPYAILLQAIVARSHLLPADFDAKNPVGTGPFKYKSFEAGGQSVFVKNPNYWGEVPNVDSLTIISMADADARVNALLSGQVHAIEAVPPGQQKTVEGRNNELLIGKGGLLLCFIMRLDEAPFTDQRIVEAVKLIPDRKQLVATALGGRGTPGNDLLGRLDPCGTGNIPQIEQDIEKAKSLLAAAGQSNLKLQLEAAPIAAGLMDASQIFSQQAKAAGVDIKVNRLDTAGFLDKWTKWPFAVDYYSEWGSMMAQAGGSFIAGAGGSATHMNNREFDSLYQQALRTIDVGARCTIINQMQKIFHDQGGYLVWGAADFVDAHSSKLGGLTGSGTKPMGSFQFERAYFTA